MKYSFHGLQWEHCKHPAWLELKYSCCLNHENAHFSIVTKYLYFMQRVYGIAKVCAQLLNVLVSSKNTAIVQLLIIINQLIKTNFITRTPF